ncbi:MAG: isochorismate synthase [Actinomycetota bacterium]|nr:isochorismate synthase [Actinomycetota bacterium]
MTAPGLRTTKREASDEIRHEFQSLDAPLKELSELVRRALEDGDSTGWDPIVSLSVKVPSINSLDWLRARKTGPKFYWSGRDDGSKVAAVGIADIQTSEDEGGGALRDLLSSLSPDSTARYYGGMRFDAARETSREWEAFGAHGFVLPRFELRCEGDETALICNLLLTRDAEQTDEITHEIESLSEVEVSPDEALPTLENRRDLPDAEGWRANLEGALAAFESGPLKKVVLARRVDLTSVGELDPLLLMDNLASRTPGCFHFYFEPEAGVAFLGASPERLYRRDERYIKSEAVAGTRPRGESAADDADLGEELLNSPKDLSEHAYVRLSIEEKLGSLCERLEVEEQATEMKLARGRHLVSRVSGALHATVTDTEVLRTLHPTPAVGGYPREDALAIIRGSEPFDRGWYAGPIGWMGAGSAEFAVGIRSGLVRGREISLYSGAGIVPGSVPDDEWAEIEQKIGDFTRIFGLEPAHARS